MLVISLDGVDFRYLDRFSDHFSNFESFRKSRTEATLDSTPPEWTMSTILPMYTDVDPSYHGISDLFEYTDVYPDEEDVVRGNDIAAPAIWDCFVAPNRRSMVVNKPVTHPVEGIDEILISGYIGPADADGPHTEIVCYVLFRATGGESRVLDVVVWGKLILPRDTNTRTTGYSWQVVSMPSCLVGSLALCSYHARHLLDASPADI